jgi:hypothetical protein
VSLTAQPDIVTAGDSAVLSWSAVNATACTGEGFATGGATSGTATVTPAATTSYGVTCTNASGGSATGAVTVTVNQGDLEAPTPPTNLQVVRSNKNNVWLAWNASSDNIGVVEYQVLRCEGAGCMPIAVLANVSTTSFRDGGVSSGTTYRYRIRALDAAGNLSGESAIVEVRVR